MAYKYAKGKVLRGDIYYEDDTQGNTYLDWSEDAVGIVAGGEPCLVISGSGAVSSSLNLSASGFYGDGSGLSGVTATASPAGEHGTIQFNDEGSTGGASSFYWDDDNNRAGIGTDNPDHEFTVVGNISASTNISASAFYGDGSNLSNVGSDGAPSDAQYVTLATDGDLSAERVLTAGDGISLTDAGAGGAITISTAAAATNIQAPFLSGSTNTYIQALSGSSAMDVVGNNFASGVRLTMDSQFTTDGHTTGSTDWNSPVSLSMAITASASTTGSYDMIATNTDGLAYTLTDGVNISSGEEISLTGSADFSVVTNQRMNGTGIESIGTNWGWNNGCISTAQITSGIEAYMEIKVPDNDTDNLVQVGLGYLHEVDIVGSSTVYDWCRWAVYGNQHVNVQAYSRGVELEVFGDEAFELNSRWRVYVLNNVVTIRVMYAEDDDFETIYTFAGQVDIASNSNLVFSATMGTNNTNGTVVNGIKLYGVFTNEP